jgi:hypothetical protein
VGQLVKQLEREFRSRAVHESPGGEFYLGPEDLLELAHRAVEVAVALIGVEALNSRPPFIQPYAPCDYSVGDVQSEPWPRICSWCADQAQRFVHAWRAEANAYAFSIVDEEEFRRNLTTTWRR